MQPKPPGIAFPSIATIVVAVIGMLVSGLRPNPKPVDPPPSPPPIVVDPKPDPKPDDKLTDLVKLIESLKLIIESLRSESTANQAQIAALESRVAELSKPQTADQGSTLVVQNKPVVTIYSPKSWTCRVCEQWKRWDFSNEQFVLKFVAKDRDSWTSYPVFNIGNDWYYGMTIEQVRRKVREQQSPQQPQPRQGKLCQCVAVTGNRQAYCPCLPLGRGCHCSPSKPHRFD